MYDDDDDDDDDCARLPLWTISLALQPADCVLYKTKMAGNILRRVHEIMIIMMSSYNVSLYEFVFFSFRKWFFQPHDVTLFGHLGASPLDPTWALPLDPVTVLSSPDHVPILLSNQNPGCAPGPKVTIKDAIFQPPKCCGARRRWETFWG